MLTRFTRPMYRFCLVDITSRMPRVTDVKDYQRKLKAIRKNVPTFEPRNDGLFFYNKGELEFKSFLVLQSQENVEEYVLALVKNYFRTTYKSGVTVESELSTHGLDSIDVIELAMQVEEDLGYVIPSETLSNFHKVKHYINYILQVEAFKEEYERDPLP